LKLKIDENLPAECASILQSAGFEADTVTEPAILALTYRIAMALINRLPAGELWIVEPDRIRFRTGR
jgi:hypothetical protein